ncbi:neopullulanase [Bacillus sp. JCM 19045]|nr:neopullulanase [Bacillus sp. JCM 19045]
MNKAAIIHTQENRHLYLVNSNQAIVRIQTAVGDVTSIQLIHGDPYDWREGKWLSHESAMTLIGMDGTHDYWSTTIHLPHSRLRYAFKLSSNEHTLVFTERGFFNEQPAHISPYFCLPYAHDSEVFSPPDWVEQTVWYQIFPERFANGDESLNPAQTLPWESAEPKPDSFFGGDLEGIIQNLDYLETLGISGIYLTPIFKAFSNHKYDTIDYFELDPQFGDKQTLKKFVTACHERGIRVMLDAVFNHSGYYFAPFQDLLHNGASSKYADWFHPHEFPLDSSLAKPNYETFAFVGSMPKLNTTHPEVKNYLLKAARYWIEEFDIDGWRLDVANEVDHAFWREFRQAVKSVKQDVYILGEIWHQAGAWLQGDQFDAVMNYPLTDAIQDYVLKNKPVQEVQKSLSRHLFSYPHPVNKVQFNMLGSHDTARVMTVSDQNKNLVKLQYFLLFSFPGSPCIYYGDEIGMSGDNDPGCRACMIWDPERQDSDMYSFLQQLIGWKNQYKAFGNYDALTFYDSRHKDVLMYALSSSDETFVVLVNRSQQSAAVQLPHSFHLKPYKDLLVDSLSHNRHQAQNYRLSQKRLSC